MARLNPLLGIGGGNWKHIKIDQIKSSVESRGETFDKIDFVWNGVTLTISIYLIWWIGVF
jgi:hypothetical protein